MWTYGNMDILIPGNHLQCYSLGAVTLVFWDRVSPCPGFCHICQAGWQVNPRDPSVSVSALRLQVLTTVASLLNSLTWVFTPFSHIAFKMPAWGPAQLVQVCDVKLHELNSVPQNPHRGRRALTHMNHPLTPHMGFSMHGFIHIQANE